MVPPTFGPHKIAQKEANFPSRDSAVFAKEKGGSRKLSNRSIGNKLLPGLTRPTSLTRGIAELYQQFPNYLRSGSALFEVQSPVAGYK